MSLVSFGDLALTYQMRRQTAEAKADMARLSQELTSGQVADTANHLAGDLGPLLAIDTSLARLEGFASVTRELGLFAEAMQTALGTMSDLALESGNVLIAAAGTAGTTHIDTAAAAAHSALKSVLSTLNTRFGDRTIFAGQNTGGAAVADSTVLMGALAAATVGTTDVAAAEAAIDAWFASPGGFDSVVYLGADPLDPVQIAPGEMAGIGITAADPALRQTLKGLAMAALLDQGAFPGQTGLRQAMAQRAGELLMTSETSRAQLAASLGATQGQLESVSARNQAEASALEIARAGMLAADPYTTATQLQDAETQLQLIYTITARLSRLSLADYL